MNFLFARNNKKITFLITVDCVCRKKSTQRTKIGIKKNFIKTQESLKQATKKREKNSHLTLSHVRTESICINIFGIPLECFGILNVDSTGEKGRSESEGIQ